MKFESKSLAVPTSAGSGAAVQVDRFTEKTVLVGGTFTATVRIQGSLDGTTWSDITADVTAPAVIEIPHTLRYVRVRTVAFTSAPAVSIGGLDVRST